MRSIQQYKTLLQNGTRRFIIKCRQRESLNTGLGFSLEQCQKISKFSNICQIFGMDNHLIQLPKGRPHCYITTKHRKFKPCSGLDTGFLNHASESGSLVRQCRLRVSQPQTHVRWSIALRLRHSIFYRTVLSRSLVR